MEHQHEHGPVSQIRDASKEPPNLVVLQVPRQRLGQTKRDPGDGIGHRSVLLIHEIIVEEADRLQAARDRLRRSSLSEKMIDIGANLLAGDLGEGYCKPSHELIVDVDIALHRVD
jgi:hypothetical protein